MPTPPSILAHQAAIADDPVFQKRVRQALVKVALDVAGVTTNPLPLRKVAQQVLDNPEDWTTAVANGLATIVTTTAVTVDDITDDQIKIELGKIILAYVPAT